MATTTTKPLSFYLDLQYPFKVTADEEGGYVIAFPDLPGCVTQVETVEEIGPMAEEARHLWITTEYAEGEEIPLPSYPEAYSGKFNLRLPRSLHRRLVELAEREGVSLNQCVVALLAQGEALSGAESAGTAEREAPANARVAEGRVGYRVGGEQRPANSAGSVAEDRERRDIKAGGAVTDELTRMAFLFRDRIYCSPGCVGDAIAGHPDAEPGELGPETGAVPMVIPDERADVVLTCAECGGELRWLQSYAQEEP